MSSSRALLAQILAAPREAGTPGAAAAREALSTHLAILGFTVEEQPFAFSPATLLAFPVLGAGLGWLALLQIPLLLIGHVPRWGALVAWLFGLGALAVLVAGMGLGWAVPGAATRQDANLIATRGTDIRCWIVAHSDSKAQGHSMAGRLVAVWIVALSVLVTTLLAMGRLALGAPLPAWGVSVGAALAVTAGTLAGRGRLRGGSRGALDNGSGMLAALVAAETSGEAPVGLLITGAEEFGLVGARVFAATRGALLHGSDVINVDTVDDRGTLYFVRHDHASETLSTELSRRLAHLAVPMVSRRLPAGIFVDSLALRRGAARTVTIGRLDWSTLRRIHTPRDLPEDHEFATAESVGIALGEMVSGGKRETGSGKGK
ncbi:MAG: M28 family peptidase [Gemmatimonadota bacterium]